MKIIIPIQSISDIVTNSSSEIFCTIFSENHINEIYKLFHEIMGNTYYDDDLYITLINKSDDDYYQEDMYKDYPDSWIEINASYSLSNAIKILQFGIEAILKDKFGNDFKIITE